MQVKLSRLWIKKEKSRENRKKPKGDKPARKRKAKKNDGRPKKPATAYKMARGQYLRLPKTEGTTARGLLLTHAVAAGLAAQVGE